MGQISRGLKILARELEIPVIAVSQLSRAVESRNPPLPMLSDLRESGQLEQDADLVMFVYREDYYDRRSPSAPGEADVIIAKHRNGPVGKVALTFLSEVPALREPATATARTVDVAGGRRRERGTAEMLRPVPDACAERARLPLRRMRRQRLAPRRGDATPPDPCRCRERPDRGIDGRLRGGIPKRMLAASLDRHPDLEPTLVRHVRRFIAEIDANVEAGRGLWFHGTVGTGKTTLALLVAKAARDAGRSVAIYSVPLLFAEMRDTFGDDSEDSHLALFTRLSEVDLLVLDDLGAERQTEWVLEQLFSLVNERWQDQRSIVVTSNVPDPYRDVTLATLRAEIGELRRRRQNGAGRDELEAVAARLERVAGQLAASDLSNDADPLTWLRQQVGSRTVSRLIEICDDPLLMMGADLRMRQGARRDARSTALHSNAACQV